MVFSTVFPCFVSFFYNVFLGPFRLWEPPLGEHIWPDSVQATAGNSRLWTGGPVDVWPILAISMSRCASQDRPNSCNLNLYQNGADNASWMKHQRDALQSFSRRHSDFWHVSRHFTLWHVCFCLEGQLALRWRTALRRDRCGYFQ